MQSNQKQQNKQSGNPDGTKNRGAAPRGDGDRNLIRRIADAFSRDLWILVLDVIAVNLAYYLALMIRFYVNNQFRPTVSYYLTDFARFAPFYTVLCIIVFAFFRLYNGMWRYAGINDMNRIICASGVTCLIQVAGTLIFIRRMPITYYGIGAALQFVFVSLIRFVYRFATAEHQKITARKTPAVNVMVVGGGDLARRAIRQMEDGSAYRPVCIIDSAAAAGGKTFDGIPVLSGGADLEQTVSRYGIGSIFIADPALSADSRANIRAFCEGKDIEIMDYTGFLSNLTGRIPLTALLDVADGKVIIRRDGTEKEYASGREALRDLTDRWDISGVSAQGSKLIIDLRQNRTEGYAGYDAWIQQYKEETGEEISYF